MLFVRRAHKGKQASYCQVCPTAFGPEETEVQDSEAASDSLYQAVPRPKKEDETRPFPKVKPEEVDAQEDEEEEEADPGSDVDFSGDDPSSGGDLEGQPQQQQLLRELAQARAAIQTLAGQVEAQQTQLNQMSQARRDSRLSDLSGMIPANEWLRVSNQGASSSFNPIVDTRTLGKPEIFKSDPSEYSD